MCVCLSLSLFPFVSFSGHLWNLLDLVLALSSMHRVIDKTWSALAIRHAALHWAYIEGWCLAACRSNSTLSGIYVKNTEINMVENTSVGKDLTKIGSSLVWSRWLVLQRIFVDAPLAVTSGQGGKPLNGSIPQSAVWSSDSGRTKEWTSGDIVSWQSWQGVASANSLRHESWIWQMCYILWENVNWTTQEENTGILRKK